MTLIDCPGFDDPKRTDKQTVGAILEYLEGSKPDCTQLHGIIYMLSITSTRVGGIDKCNMSMFRELCGKDFYSNVILCTSHWDELQNVAEGLDREDNLRTNDDFWGLLAAKNSPLRRVAANGLAPGTPSYNRKMQGFTVLEGDADKEIIIEIAQNHYPRMLCAQEEMAEGRSIEDTSALREINVWHHFLQQQRYMMGQLQGARETYEHRLKQGKRDREQELLNIAQELSQQQQEDAMKLAREREEHDFQMRKLQEQTSGRDSSAGVIDASGLPRRSERVVSNKRKQEHEKTMEDLRGQLDLVKDQSRKKRHTRARQTAAQCRRRHRNKPQCG